MTLTNSFKKRFPKAALLLTAMVIQAFISHLASQQVAYIYTDSVLKAMPGYSDSMAKTYELQKVYQNQYLMLMYDLQKKAAEFQQRKDSMIPVIAQMKWKEIERMKADADTFLQKANSTLEYKRAHNLDRHLMQLQKLLQTMAGERKCTAIYDLPTVKADGLIYNTQNSDITTLVIAEIKRLVATKITNK